MAQEVNPLVLSRNTGSALTTAHQAVWDSDSGGYIDFFDTTQNNQNGRFIVIVASDSDANAGGVYLNIKTSTNNPYTGSGQSDYGAAMSTEDVSFHNADNAHITVVGPLETARYLDTDGHVNLTLGSSGGTSVGTAGNVYVTAIVIP
jgi:hypothetical protein